MLFLLLGGVLRAFAAPERLRRVTGYMRPSKPSHMASLLWRALTASPITCTSGTKGLEFFAEGIVIAGAEAEDDVVEAAEPLLGAVLPLDLYVVVGDLEYLGIYVDVNPVGLQRAHKGRPVGHADAGEDLGEHLYDGDLDVADARVEAAG